MVYGFIVANVIWLGIDAVVNTEDLLVNAPAYVIAQPGKRLTEREPRGWRTSSASSSYRSCRSVWVASLELACQLLE